MITALRWRTVRNTAVMRFDHIHSSDCDLINKVFFVQILYKQF